MINLVLVTKDMLRYVQDVGTVREMGQGLSDQHAVLCKVRFVLSWTKRRDVVVGTRRIRSKNMVEHQYREGYGRSLEGKRGE